MLWFVQEYLRGRRSTLSAAAPEPSTTRSAEPTPAATTPEALAQQGLHTEAIHALLLLALAKLSQRRPQLRASSTSRELLQERELFSAAYHEMALLVDAVERSRFGGRAMHQDDFDGCLAAYRLLEKTLP